MTQEAFAEKLNLSKNYVWMLEKGERVASERTISDICREFAVNEEWLRNGDGEPYKKRTRNQEMQAFMNDVMELSNEQFKRRFVEALTRLDSDDWEELERIARKALKEGF